MPDFLAALASSDPLSGYQDYFDRHRAILSSYWHNYVVDAEGLHFAEIVRSTVVADRADLHTLLASRDIERLVRHAAEQATTLLESDVEVDVVLMVGVGAANAGELVVDGRGIAFVCLEHFTGVPNPTTQGLALDAEVLPLWLAHEIAHVVRYTSPTSRSDLRNLISIDGGHYSYWESARHATLRELLVNEGLAVQTSRAISPGHAAWEYFGYGRRQYARVRELEQVLARVVAGELDSTGLGLRLRYLSGGIGEEARMVQRHVLPERSGYWLGARMVEPAIRRRGLAWSVRASAHELSEIGLEAAASA